MKKGFTLMELMVYMAIVGIIVVVAGQAFSNSTKFRVRTQNMLKATQEAENIATLFRSDVSQMGAKSSLETKAADGNDDTFSDVFSDVYMDLATSSSSGSGSSSSNVADFSSFRLNPEEPAANTNLSSFTFRRVRYGSTGKYEAVEEIIWYLDGTTLKRRCQILKKAAGAGDNDCAPSSATGSDLLKYDVEMATRVDSFKVQPAIPSALESEGFQMFPPSDGNTFKLVSRYGEDGYSPLTVGAGGSSVSLNNFVSNFDPTALNDVSTNVSVNEVYVFANTATAGDWKSLCNSEASNHFTFEPGVEYEISFSVSTPGTNTNPDESQMFVPGVDHMAVGIRNADSEKLGQKIKSVDDFLFFPPTMEEVHGVQRTVRFSVPENVNACVAFTFAFFSPIAASGSITIGNFKLNKVATSNYQFNDSDYFVSKADKKNVKAFKLKLQITRGVGETGRVDMVIPTPSNGPKD